MTAVSVSIRTGNVVTGSLGTVNEHLGSVLEVAVPLVAECNELIEGISIFLVSRSIDSTDGNEVLVLSVDETSRDVVSQIGDEACVDVEIPVSSSLVLAVDGVVTMEQAVEEVLTIVGESCHHCYLRERIVELGVVCCIHDSQLDILVFVVLVVVPCEASHTLTFYHVTDCALKAAAYHLTLGSMTLAEHNGLH